MYDIINLSIGALTNNQAAVNASKIDSARKNGFRVLRTEYWFRWVNATIGEGPIMCGVAFAQGTSSIPVAILADPQSSGSGDKIAQDEAMQPVFPLADLFADAVGDQVSTKTAVQVFKPRWSVIEGESMNWFVFNHSGATLTTGSTLKIFAKHFGVWLRD